MKTFTFNKAATSVLEGAPLVRIRIRNGVVEIRPTNRTKGLSNLKKTVDVVVPVAPHGRDGARVRMQETIVGSENLEAGKMELVAGKYGWLRLEAASTKRGPLVTVA